MINTLCVALCILCGPLCNKKNYKNLHRVTQRVHRDPQRFKKLIELWFQGINAIFAN